MLEQIMLVSKVRFDKFINDSSSMKAPHPTPHPPPICFSSLHFKQNREKICPRFPFM